MNFEILYGKTCSIDITRIEQLSMVDLLTGLEVEMDVEMDGNS